MYAGQKCPTIGALKGSELVRKLKGLAKKRGVSVELTPERGKGSHSTLHSGEAHPVMPDLKKELPTGTFNAILTRLGVAKEDLEQ